MSHEFDVLVYGTVCLDLVWQVPELPGPGGYVNISADAKMIGGEAANTAIALTTWGAKVALVGTALGDDEDGALLRFLFARDAPGIDTRFLAAIPGARTPFCACLATPDGHRTMYGRGFTDMQCPTLTPELARSAPLFTMDPNAWQAGLRACAVAAEAGMSVVAMDYTPESAVNRVAAVSVTSYEHVGAEIPVRDHAAFAAALRDTYGGTAIVTLGKRGCFVAERGGNAGSVDHVPAYVAPAMVDSTGSGDIFRAGLLFGRMQGWSMRKTAEFASAAAALNCGAMGGWGGVRSAAEIEAFQRSAPLHNSLEV